jgi:hypothetical protein
VGLGHSAEVTVISPRFRRRMPVTQRSRRGLEATTSKGARTSEVFVLEFQAANAPELYEKVSQHLGTNHHDGTGNWPAGLVTHMAGIDGDKLVVIERWESMAAQEHFMKARLGPALGAVGVPAPARAQWLSDLGFYQAKE